MAELKQKVKLALDEGRMLILGAQVLIGFHYRAAFEKGFEALPVSSRWLNLAGLGLLLGAVALLIWPASYHRIVERGETTPSLHSFTTRVVGLALLPLALGLGVDLYMAAERTLGRRGAVITGVAGTVVALVLWYGIETVRRSRRRPSAEGQPPDEPRASTSVFEKIDHVLTEARMVLPGVQALLGFQFAVTLVESFGTLPRTSQYTHLASLACIALSAILLIAPAAYHRIVEEGEPTEHFHRLASFLVMLGSGFLALGISGDVFVVVRKVADSLAVALVAAAASLVTFGVLWFGVTTYQRARNRRRRRGDARPHARAA
jgi:hypothetical protein